MSDKNPHYSIPKALGEPATLIELSEPSPNMSAMIKAREEIERQIWEAFSSLPPSRPTALALRGGRLVSLEIGDDGKVIDPPAPCPRCGPILLCAKHAAMIG